MGKRSRRQRPGRGRISTRPVADASPTATTLARTEQQLHRALVAERHLRNRERGDPLAQAKRWMQEFLSFSNQDPWNTERFNIFYSYVQAIESILLTNAEFDYDRKREHLHFLKKIRRNREEPTFYRALAYGATGYFYLNYSNDYGVDLQGQVLKYVNKSISLLNSADNSEKQRIICLDGEIVYMEALFQSHRESLTSFSTEFPANFHNTYSTGGWSPYGTDMQHISIIAGCMCDYCEKISDDLRCCAKCKMMYYCSKECQEKAWNEHGHKLVCRKKGDFRVGDIALVSKSVEAIRSGRKVELIAKVPPTFEELNDTDTVDENAGSSSLSRWVVKEQNGSELGTVSEDTLRRVRSSVWYQFTRSDLEMITEAVLARDKNSAPTSDDKGEVEESVPQLLSNRVASEEECDVDSDNEN